MALKIAIVGTLDTKGEEIGYLKRLIEGLSHQAVIIDAGILGEPLFEPTFTRQRVAQASGSRLEDIIALGSEGKAIDKMAEGAARIVAELDTRGELDGVLGLGGTMGTFLGLAVMRALHMGLPKLIISTTAFSHMITPDDVCGDLIMMQWPGGFWGLNSMSKGTLSKAAEGILGAANAHKRREAPKKKIVGVTSLGIRASRYVLHLKPLLEQRGYEMVAFHTDGMGGRVFEQAIAEGSIDVALDLSAYELVNHVCGGICSAGEHRLEAAGRKGIPQIVAPGSIDTLAWPPQRPLPKRFAGRFQHLHNPLLLVIPTSSKEQAAVAKGMAQKLNKAKGPTAFIMPMGGFSTEDCEGGLWPNPSARDAFASTFKRHIKPHVDVVEVVEHINHPVFAERVVSIMDTITPGILPGHGMRGVNSFNIHE